MSLDAKSLAARTLELCRIPSPIGSEGALCDHLERWALTRFSPAEVRRIGNSLVLGAPADERPRVALLGHLDTVPAPTTREGAGVMAEPRIEGERLWGLGASDMKGGVAVMLGLAEALDFKGLPLNLMLVLYEREEGPYEENGLEAIRAALPEIASLKLAICLEPTDGQIQLGCVGGLHAAVRFAGRRAHSARPWQGENAIHKAGPLLARLLQRAPHPVVESGLEFLEVLSATVAKGGGPRNVIPDRFELNLNYRFAPGRSVAQAEAELRDWIGPGPEVEIVDRSPSGRVCRDNALVERLIRACRVEVTSKQAWTDVGRLSSWGVDAVNFGPGETAQAHQADESCFIPRMEAVARQLGEFLSSPL